MTKVSATTNNALEAFNNHEMSLQISSGVRLTVPELILSLNSFMRAISYIEREKDDPVCAMDVWSTFHTTSELLRHVRSWFVNAELLWNQIASCEVPLYKVDNGNNLILLSGKNRSLNNYVYIVGTSIESIDDHVEEKKHSFSINLEKYENFNIESLFKEIRIAAERKVSVLWCFDV